MGNTICIGMVGAGRATELHMEAYRRVHDITIRPKLVVARREKQLRAIQKRYGFENISLSFEDLLNDPEIDVIDICTTPDSHVKMAEAALLAGKHVICEKPLTGYFGKNGDVSPIGNVSKKKMYEELMNSLDKLRGIVTNSNRKFMYAENFIYAPSIVKTGDIIKAKKSRILFMKGEESLKGSSSHVAGEWDKTGGGTFIRTGSHPLSAVLWLKQKEAEALGKEIWVESVLGDMARVTPALSEYERRHISARPHDVEDVGTVIVTFSDQSRAVVIATDTLLGGSKNYVEIYCNDAAINCKLTMADMMSTYFLDEDGLADVPISEMLPAKIGWNNPFIADEVLRGYTGEIQNFMDAIAFGRNVESNFQLAYDTIKVIYAAYLSAEQGKRIYF